jgi:hypothetical protein
MQESMKAVLSEGRGTFKASGAITKGMIVKPTTTEGTWIKCGAGEAGKAVADEAAADGAYFSATLIGGTEVVAGAAMATPGTYFMSDANGAATPVTAVTDRIVGYTLGVAASGDTVPCIVLPSQYAA